MAVPQIVPQSAPPAYPHLALVAALLQQTHADLPAYGVPFCRALDRALRCIAAGRAYEPYNATHYRVASQSRPWQWHYVTLDQCGCATRTPWCWHRALLHLLTAYAALFQLERCPRPTLAYVPPREPHDLAAILRDCDELFA